MSLAVHSAVSLPTVDEIERIHQQAREEGYAAGYQTGREDGLKVWHGTRRSRSCKTAGVAPQLRTGTGRCRSGDRPRSALARPRSCEADDTRGAADKAGARLRRSARMPQAESAFSQPAQLFLHPEDAALVRQYLSHELNECVIRHLIRSWSAAAAASRSATVMSMPHSRRAGSVSLHRHWASMMTGWSAGRCNPRRPTPSNGAAFSRAAAIWLPRAQPFQLSGSLTRVTGLVMEASGLKLAVEAAVPC